MSLLDRSPLRDAQFWPQSGPWVILHQLRFRLGVCAHNGQLVAHACNNGQKIKPLSPHCRKLSFISPLSYTRFVWDIIVLVLCNSADSVRSIPSR